MKWCDEVSLTAAFVLVTVAAVFGLAKSEVEIVSPWDQSSAINLFHFIPWWK